MNKTDSKIGFIGCGHMASAIIQGILASHEFSASDICASEINEELALKKENELGIKVFCENNKVAELSDAIFIATKPNAVEDILKSINIAKGKLIISIAAGVSTAKIQDAAGNKNPVIRVMPNNPAMIQEGMSAIVKGEFADENHVEFTKKILSTIGKCIETTEDKIDVVTAISGSGPAFFYEIIHEMALAGEKLGLEYEKSLTLACQTALGSAKVLMQSTLSPEQLVQSVATKGGCTEVGINYMKEKNTEGLFYELIEKTADKAKTLG